MQEEEKSYFEKIEHNILSDDDSWTWKQKIEELYRFLRGTDKPEAAVNYFKPKLSHKAAKHLIWFLQEFTGIIPDQFEFCEECGDEVYDSHREGHWSEFLGKGFCDNHAWDNPDLAFCEDCGDEVSLKKYSKRYDCYLCDYCRKKRNDERTGQHNDSTRN
jgi:RNA polymerase-binding transcription factor DksA